MSVGTHICRLCRISCPDSIRLCDATGKTNEIYTIAVKFFHPLFLKADKEHTPNRIVSLCTKCWQHISAFNNFQQSVLLLHTNLQTAADNALARGQLEHSNDDHHIDIKTERIQIDSDDGDDREVSRNHPQNNNTGRLIVNDYAMEFPGATSTNPNISSENDDSVPFAIENVRHIDEEFSHQSGDVFIVNELNEEMENSCSSYNDYLLERRDIQDSSDPGNNINVPYSRKSRLSQNENEIDNIIAKWRPTLQCQYCAETFATFTLLKIHNLNEHPNDEFFIMCCKRKFKVRYRIEEHAIMHLNPEAFKCLLCGKCFTTRFGLVTHMAQNHPGATKWGNTDHVQPNNYRFKCSLCGMSCADERALRKHSKMHLSGKQYHCQYCSKSFKLKSGLIRHFALFHPDKPSVQPSSTIIQCKVCPKTFKYRTGLYYHEKTTHPEEFAKRRKKNSGGRKVPEESK
ncbi:zinc finger protein 567-like [Musca vetustissima]|uniref:zinc finger protein 567-like n=1 Tax=Musca vetustissima TaxID=27455 RepID=UPI002AB7CDA8|nr:zinc finger protein 567-like [Musca vetustissima]